MKQINFKKLSILELSILLQHLQLGIEHLKKYLSNTQISDLLETGALEKEQKEKIKISAGEKHGKLILTINVIFTAFLGAWLPAASFIGAKAQENKVLFFSTVIIASLASAYFGYKSFKHTQKRATNATNKQKISNLQLAILHRMKSKRQQHIGKIIHYLNEAVSNEKSAKKSSTYSFKSKQDFVDWFNQLKRLSHTHAGKIPDSELQNIFSKQIENILSLLETNLENNIEIAEKHKQTKTQASSSTEKKSVLQTLTDPTIYIPKAAPQEKTWLKDNFNSIAIGFIPTVMSGFGSLFVYFMGIPEIAKQFGVTTLNPLLEDFRVKLIALVIIIAITLYFGCSFLYVNKKEFNRDQELKATQKNVGNEEAHLLETKAKLNALRKMKQQVKSLLALFGIIDAVLARWPSKK